MIRTAINHATSQPDQPRRSSLRFAFVTMGIVPAASGAGVALAMLLLAPSAGMIAAFAVLLFAVNALAMPVVLDRRISLRLTAVADALRAARDGRAQRAPYIADSDAIGDIARLANDIVAAQIDVGRYAISLQNAEEFSRISDQTMHRLAVGAQGVDRMLAGLQSTAEIVSRSSERVAASLDAAAIINDQTARDFVTTAGRVTRSAETIVLSAGKAALAMAPPRQTVPYEAAPSPALDAILGKLDDLGRAIAGLPAVPNLRDISDHATSPVLARLSELLAETQLCVASLELPIVESRHAIETRLNDLDSRIAASLEQPRVAPVQTSAELAGVTEAIMRLEQRIVEQPLAPAPIINVPPAPEFDPSPFLDGVQRLERRLVLLTERPITPADPVDLQPVLLSLAAIESKLAAIEAASSSTPVSHPDLALVAEFDAARAPLQRLLVAFRLAVRDIGLESGRLRTTIDEFAAPAAAEVPLFDLSPLSAQLDDVATRLASLEAVAQESFRHRPAHPDLGLLAEFEAGKAPMQRIMVGFRLALREIGSSAAQLRETVGQIAVQPVTEVASAEAIDLTPITSRLDDLAVRLQAIEAATRDAIDSPLAMARVDSQILPQLAVNRTAMSKALTGMQLMMREVADNAAALRSAAEALPGNVEVIAPSIDLSSITGPLGALREELAAGHAVLAEMQAQMSRDAQSLQDSSTPHVDLNLPSLVTTLSLMSGFSSAVEARFGDIEGRISEVARRYGSGQGRAAAEELVVRLLNATSELRGEVGKFLAVGAALSREIEIASTGAGRPSKASHPERSLTNYS